MTDHTTLATEALARKCEACGLHGQAVALKQVRTTNGGLFLCEQCLNDINRKNPLLLAVQRERDELAAERDQLKDEIIRQDRDRDRLAAEVAALKMGQYCCICGKTLDGSLEASK